MARRDHDSSIAWNACQNPPVETDQEIDRVVLAIAKQLRSGFALVAIDGPGGSGKSTLAAELGERLGGLGQITVVHGDDFYRPMAAEDRLLLSPQDGYTQYFDWQRLRDQVLIPLAAGIAGQYQRYDWPSGVLAAGEVHHVPRSGVVIVEGVYTARPELAGYYDLTVWVDTPWETCMRRLDERGHDHGPGNWNERWRAAEEHYIATTQPGTRLDLAVKGY
jgi:uridine kinase